MKRVPTPRGSIQHLRRAHEGMGALIDEAGPFKIEIPSRQTALESLIRSIIYQQLTGKAAGTIHGRFLKKYGKGPGAVRVLAREPLDSMRSVGLSRQKALAIQDLTRKVQSGELNPGRLHAFGDEEVITRLTTVRGIGRWSAQMFLMFHLGRLDVWPVGDYAIRKACGLMEGHSSPLTEKETESFGRCFHPYASIAAWYLWCSVD